MSQISPGKKFQFRAKEKTGVEKSFDSGLCLVDILLCDAFTLVRIPTDGSRIIQKRHAATALFGPQDAKKARNSGLSSYLHHFWQVNLARQEGLEPPTFWFVAKHSIRLSYWRKNYQKGTRLSDSLLIIVEHKKNVKY